MAGISCQPPEKYGARMLHFVDFISYCIAKGLATDKEEKRKNWLKNAQGNFFKLPEFGRKDLSLSTIALSSAAFAAVCMFGYIRYGKYRLILR